MPEQFLAHNGGGYHQGYGGGKPYQGYHEQQQQQPQMGYQQGGGGGGGGQNANAELEAEVKKYLPKVLRVIKRQCCTVM